jgi:hypothetical protein
MATLQRKNWCALHLGRKETLKTVQIEFRTQFGMEPCGLLFMYTKCETFKRKACFCKGKRPGWSFVSDAAVLCVRVCFKSSLQNSPWLCLKTVLEVHVVQLLLAVFWPAAGYVVSVVVRVHIYKIRGM